jgi:putative restriction endonuclease
MARTRTRRGAPAVRFGELPGQPVGTTYEDREELRKAGGHRHKMNGIAGRADEGADAIVLNGGYEDDEDRGDWVLYTGEGGNDTSTKRQIADQSLTKGNAALARSATEGIPVRVYRGPEGDPAFSPVRDYRYDGLYRVTSWWPERGRSGFRVFRYLFERDDPAPPTWSAAAVPPKPVGLVASPPPAGPAPRAPVVGERIVRDTVVVRAVKRLHHSRCQVCGVAIELPFGAYAEGAHVRPLGRPHNGHDVQEDLLCLCPNDHVRFDGLAIYVTDDLRVVETATGRTVGRLRTARGHHVDPEHLRYHRRLCRGGA